MNFRKRFHSSCCSIEDSPIFVSPCTDVSCLCRLNLISLNIWIVIDSIRSVNKENLYIQVPV